VNLLGDFGGGGLICALGILLALIERNRSGCGQVVDAAMIDGAAYLSTFIYKMNSDGMWGQRGTNMLDSGSHFYEVYRTKDDKFISVGAIEPQFYDQLLKGLKLDSSSLPAQMDKSSWLKMKELFATIFASKTRMEWMTIFDGTDACVAPIMDMNEVMDHSHSKERNLLSTDGTGTPLPTPSPRLSRTPAKIAFQIDPLPGQHTLQVLKEFGFKKEEIDQFTSLGAINRPNSQSKL